MLFRIAYEAHLGNQEAVGVLDAIGILKLDDVPRRWEAAKFRHRYTGSAGGSPCSFQIALRLQVLGKHQFACAFAP
ncbi:hypothetical protein MOX02_28630 [Methylobacterium oxalidis]|uniref:Uncharacterized protein n=1 Tax=Methylobacterium oxalidis TaxID=944322 RepID=A0A512J4D6_9HYPH|nr:hypothetical protein MOX02_28630 [Methylobacterium oxalidis]GLS63650.1 hypothetical protein GCM10007888_20310 [Methylobacterium oxalidis]